MKRSLFVKVFTSFALVVTISFITLGSVLLYQVNKFAGEEKGAILSQTLGKAVSQTVSYISLRSELQASVSEKTLIRTLNLYTQNMVQYAADCGGTIFICDDGGNILFLANSEGGYSQPAGVIPQSVSDAIRTTGTYSGVSNMGGYLKSSSFVIGTKADAADGSVLVFVALPAETTLSLFSRMSRIFILMTVVVLVLSLLVTTVICRIIVRPLREMADAARSFARGDYSARVKLPRQQNELYDLAVSFNNMAQAVENTEASRRGLMANVAHDLRTPMTTIAGFVDAIIDGTIGKDKEEYYLKMVSDETKRLSRLASNMLEMSKLDSGERVFQCKPFDVSEIVRRVIINFEQRLSDKKVDVELLVPDVLTVTADHDAVFQVIYNLVENAVKFVNEGGKISISLSEKNGEYQFNIVNTGAEIPPEDIKNIFDRFYKGDSSRSDSKNGSGLGLYIVKTVVNRHGGDVFVRSAGGETEFCFKMPVKAEDRENRHE